MKYLGEFADDLLDRQFSLLGRCINLVFEIGNVTRVKHLGITPREDPVEQVEYHRRARIADVREAVNRRPANVQGDAPGVTGDELFLTACQGVVELDAHGLRFQGRPTYGRPNK